MNIIKEMLNLPDTPSGKKKLNKLITKLGLGKKQKGDILKNVVSGDIGGGSGKEYDDLHTYLYYDDRIINIDSIEAPLCAIVADMMMQLTISYPYINTIVKTNNTEDIFGINYGNYLPLEAFLGGSGNEQVLFSIKSISIPKYVFPEYLMHESGIPLHTDKMHIFDLIKLLLSNVGAEEIEFLKTQPTITREEFFDLLK